MHWNSKKINFSFIVYFCLGVKNLNHDTFVIHLVFQYIEGVLILSVVRSFNYSKYFALTCTLTSNIFPVLCYHLCFLMVCKFKGNMSFPVTCCHLQYVLMIKIKIFDEGLFYPSTKEWCSCFVTLFSPLSLFFNIYIYTNYIYREREREREWRPALCIGYHPRKWTRQLELKILNWAVCILHSANIFGKGICIFIYSSTWAEWDRRLIFLSRVEQVWIQSLPYHSKRVQSVQLFAHNWRKNR